MKTKLVNSGLGLLAQRVRDWGEMRRASRGSAETLGAVANDQLARFLLERLCLPGRTFVDVGAHIGSVINGVRRHSRPDRIVAAEAMPDKVAVLRRNFPEVEIHGCAVGAEQGEVPFFIDIERSGYSSLDPAAGKRAASVSEIRVPLRRLDDLVAHAGVDVVKIDVEGAELGVLQGAAGVIAASRPTILFESGPEETPLFPKDALWRWFEDNGYAVLVPNRLAHLDDGLSLDGFREAHLYPRRTTNYFGVARERRAELRARARALLGLG